MHVDGREDAYAPAESLTGEAADSEIAFALGPTLELTPGSLASIPAGAVTTCQVTAPFKEFWVLA